MSKKSKKELAKAEAMMAKAQKMQAKAKKMREEAATMQLAMLQAGETTSNKPLADIGALIIQPQAQVEQPAASETVSKSSTEQSAASGTTDSPAQATDSGIISHIKRHRMMYAAIVAVIILSGIYLGYAGKRAEADPATSASESTSEQKETRMATAQPAISSQLPTRVEVLDKWEMPDELREISSNAFIDADRMACIQDNDGIIYTYNLKTRQIESRLQFGDPGDYEAVSVVGNIYYALRSDGLLFEVRPSASGKPAVEEYNLPLKAKNETEPMVYDAPNNRLLVGVKEKDPQSSDYKGVYSFDLRTKKMELKPVMTIPVEHDEAEGSSKKKKSRPIKPSEIAIDPKSGDLYVLNGPHAEFLIVDKKGALKQIIQLDKGIFPQPEGMCFSASGDLYISSEGSKKGVGIIAKVALR